MGGCIVKLGGSLADALIDLVPVLLESKEGMLIVPGGGAGADAVRSLDPDPDTAHWMAIAAMEHYGHHIASFGIPSVDRLIRVDQPSVLLPYCLLRNEDPLPHSWDITSDTIAAWVAWRLNLPLIILKSVDGVISSGRVLSQVYEPLETDTVDPALIPYILQKGLYATVQNGRKNECVRRALSGDYSQGTCITSRTEEL
ncbi:MAG: uridylate kinase [Methanocalculus sp.]|uniref:amino acid kinase family protein n=1 Tax=Methanocalculus sp. TaxID=2004547 RepID=UPI00271F61A0|nr:uridylate kinase [Methanocalculus sp.]MDO9540288.1 uridylate kinase [Methanocalculus sp.]